MTQRKRRWLWTTVGAVALMAPQGVQANGLTSPGTAGKAEAPAAEKTPASAEGGHSGGGAQRSTPPGLSSTAQGGEGGEGGEAGQGGEGGVDPARAANDATTYLIALDVIRAHFIAGRDAYAAGDREAGTEMFAHGMSEVYVDLEDTFRERGAEPFGEALNEAITKAADGAPQEEVAAAADTVIAALDAAAEKAPQDGGGPGAQAQTIAEMIDRAALQYSAALKEPEGEAYLDGYGLYKAAEARAEALLESLGSDQTDFGDTLREALSLLAEAYPSVEAPEPLPEMSGELLGAASRVALGASSL